MDQSADTAEGAAAGGGFDGWDFVGVLGTIMLFAGLWLWVGLGCGLTVVGGLLLALSVAGARSPEAAAVDGSGRAA